MADGIFEAVKVAIQKELEEVRSRQREQDEHVAEVRLSLEQLTGRLDARGQEAQQLREEVERNKSAVESLDAKFKQDLSALDLSWQERLARVESDEQGVGGLEQVWRKLGSLAEDLAAAKGRVEEHGKVVGSTKSRTDAFGDKLKELSKKSEDVQAAFQANDERLAQVEASSLSVCERQQVVEDSVAKKYSTLWQDVLVAIEDVKSSQAQVLKDDLERRSQESKHEGRGHVKYVTQLVAAVHDERKRLALTKDLMNVWREQTWTTARRRTGLHWLSRTLQSMALQRQRKAVVRWVRRSALDVAVEDLASRLRREYQAQIPDVLQVVEGTGLRLRCDKLDGDVAELWRVKCSNEQLEELVAGTASLLESKLEDSMGLVHSMRSELLEHHRSAHEELLEHHKSLHASVTQAHEKHDKLGERIEELSCVTDHAEKLEEHSRRLGGIHDTLAACATSQEVQNMLQDILLMWNSIKQLDIAKADRKDVDAFTAEAVTKDKQATKKLQDVHSQVTGLVQEQVSRVDDKVGRVSEKVTHVENKVEARWTELDGKVDDGVKQFQRWEEMWEKLAGCVEELVSKVAEIQQNAATNRLPPTSARPPSRPSSAQRSGRGDAPKHRSNLNTSDRSLPESASMDMLFIAPVERSEKAGTSASDGEAAGTDDARWAASARRVVDAALDQTVAPGSARARPSRPRSASGRRSVDRGMA